MSFILNSTHSLISLLCNGFWSFFNPNLFIIHRYKHLTTSDGVLSIYILIYTFFLLWISFYFFTILFGHSIEFYTLYEQIISCLFHFRTIGRDLQYFLQKEGIRPDRVDSSCSRKLPLPATKFLQRPVLPEIQDRDLESGNKISAFSCQRGKYQITSRHHQPEVAQSPAGGWWEKWKGQSVRLGLLLT